MNDGFGDFFGSKDENFQSGYITGFHLWRLYAGPIVMER